VKNRYMNVLLTMGVAAGLAVTASAGQTPAPATTQTQAKKQPDPARQVHNLSAKLGLNADQQTQLLPVFTDRSQQMTAIRADTTLTAKERHAKMLSLRQDSDAKIKAVLTDAQKQQYDQLQQRARKNHKAKS
jgi:periplasmic protein CpxP/Spy